MAVQNLFKNEFAEATFDTEKIFVYFQYFESTKDMKEEEYKETLIVFLDALKKLYADNAISDGSLLQFADLRKMYFTIVPELQEWVDREFSSNIRVFSKKSAILLPKDIFANVSIQQIVEEENSSKISIQYFDNKAEAMTWLFE